MRDDHIAQGLLAALAIGIVFLASSAVFWRWYDPCAQYATTTRLDGEGHAYRTAVCVAWKPGRAPAGGAP